MAKKKEAKEIKKYIKKGDKKGNEEKRRLPINWWLLFVSLIFSVAGYFLIKYALTLPCDIGRIEPEGIAQGLEPVLEFPKEVQRLICLSTDFRAIISMLVGTLAIIVGIPGIFRGLTSSK
ncbi:MAG: hypothetical protein AABX59_01060 [Nanoarchaeota archaeon]